jgi:Rieske Fe-S protein
VVAGWSGSSLTANNNTWSFRNATNTYLYQRYPQNWYSFPSTAESGFNIWANLVNLSELGTPDMLVIDTANSTGTGFQAASLEAYIRRVWTANPNTRLFLWNFAQVSNIAVNASINTPTNQADIDAVEAVCAHYGVTLLDAWGAIQALVTGGQNLSTYYADTAHLNQAGHEVAYSLLSPYLPNGGATLTGSLPARIYDNGDYESAPTITLGTSYDSRSGTWSDTLTRTQSSEVGAIITYSATCQSFGCYRADGGTNDVQVSIDGGAYADSVFYQNGTVIAGARAAHTIAIKVKSGTVRIDEFWAI